MNRLELLAESLLLGVLVAVAAVPVVTLPAALAAGCAGVRRIAGHRKAGARVFAGDLRRALRTSAPAGAAVAGGGALLGFDAFVLLRSAIPGRTAVAVVVAAVALAGLVVLVRAAAGWRPEQRWTASLRAAGQRGAADLSGSALLAAAVVTVSVLTWQLPALLPLTLGCLVVAGVAVETRAAARHG
ncbi:hypothetical protein BJF78_10020 [Pseudonocardia sp. CNS-139]|nr:hypothetical protein BJF78_10020 [Pseudonocardia sp. CNS-139]